MSFKRFDPKKIGMKNVYHLLISGIAPRPIALVGSKDKNGNVNLAPFSFFNGFGANPPIVGFSPTLSGKTGLPKDTLLNIKENNEFTISVVTSDIVNQVSLSSCEYQRDVDEFVKAGFTKQESNFVNVPGVKESPFIMECKLHDIIELGGNPASGNLILGEVILFHVNDDIIKDGSNIDPIKIDQIGRSGGPWYVETKSSLFKLNKPNGIGIGFDTLPIELLNSNLSAKSLAKLASCTEIPTYDKKNPIEHGSLDDYLNVISKLLNENNVKKAWQVILSWKNKNE